MSDKPKKKRSKKKDVGSSTLPEEIEKIRSRVSVGVKAPTNVSGIDAADAFASLGIDNSFQMSSFKKNLKIKIIEMNDEFIQFDIIGIDTSLANAFRRILLSEVPTMAIEKVRVFQNTSIIQDEVLAHRLGLVPLKADPRLFEYVEEADGVPNENNTLVFTLDIACTRNAKAPESAPNEEKFVNSTVLSNQLTWIPQGKQAERFKSNPISTVHDKIVLAKLRPGQSLEVECHAVKGVGKTHAKWSPVATASYRLMPEINFLQAVKGEDAETLKKKCPMDVFDIEDLGEY